MSNPKAIRTYHIPAGDGLDDIDLIIFDHEPQQARLTIRCYDHAWTAWRGSYGAASIEEYLIQGYEKGIDHTQIFKPSTGFEKGEYGWLKKIIQRICNFLIEHKTDVDNQYRFLLMPTELTPVLKSVLGIMCFEVGHFAEIYRQAGFEIQCKAEEEQAFCLHRFLSFALVHGSGWLEVANDEIKQLKHEILIEAISP